MEKIELLNFRVSTGMYNDFVREIVSSASSRHSDYTCVANVHMLVEAKRDPEFAAIVNNAEAIAPDGKPLVWSLRLLHGIRQDRVAGMDLLPDLLKELMVKKMSVFFYGGSDELLEKTKLYLSKNYPNLDVKGLYSPPFRKLSQEEDDEIINMINNSGAHIVFVVLGCPKQEKWMASMKGKINATMIGVGGALPVMVGLQKRAPKWMQDIGMEWLYRLVQEPRRLFKRYAVTNTIFLFLLLKAVLKKRLFKVS